MSRIFTKIRLSLFAASFICSAIVLGITANLTSLFFPVNLHDYSIFTLVVAALTIVVFIILALRSKARIEVIALFVLMVLWLALAAYTVDVIGYQDCYALRGQTVPTKTGTYSAQSFCQQMKVIEAFAWANFVILLMGFLGLLTLLIRLHSRGHPDVWRDSMSQLSWSGERDTEANPTGGKRYLYYPGGRNRENREPQVIHQQPGHSVIIQGGNVTQVPGNARSLSR